MKLVKSQLLTVVLRVWCGRNFVIDAVGGVHEQPGKVTLTLRSEETVVVETPGGGVWGLPIE